MWSVCTHTFFQGFWSFGRPSVRPLHANSSSAVVILWTILSPWTDPVNLQELDTEEEEDLPHVVSDRPRGSGASAACPERNCQKRRCSCEGRVCDIRTIFNTRMTITVVYSKRHWSTWRKHMQAQTCVYSDERKYRRRLCVTSKNQGVRSPPPSPPPPHPYPALFSRLKSSELEGKSQRETSTFPYSSLHLTYLPPPSISDPM